MGDSAIVWLYLAQLAILIVFAAGCFYRIYLNHIDRREKALFHQTAVAGVLAFCKAHRLLLDIEAAVSEVEFPPRLYRAGHHFDDALAELFGGEIDILPGDVDAVTVVVIPQTAQQGLVDTERK